MSAHMIMVNLVAEALDGFYGQVCEYVTKHADFCLEFDVGTPFAARQRVFDQGAAQVAAMDGLRYVRRYDGQTGALGVIAAPVPEGERYANRAVSYCEVVVAAETKVGTFLDLKGRRVAVSQKDFHSCYNATRYHLARLGETSGFFAETVEAGSPEASLSLVLDGRVDAAAIDSAVLEARIRAEPAIATKIKVVESLGPSPMPPVVVSRHVSYEQRVALKKILTGMHKTEEGRSYLRQAAASSFIPIEDLNYDPIRLMEELASRVRL